MPLRARGLSGRWLTRSSPSSSVVVRVSGVICSAGAQSTCDRATRRYAISAGSSDSTRSMDSPVQVHRSTMACPSESATTRHCAPKNVQRSSSPTRSCRRRVMDQTASLPEGIRALTRGPRRLAAQGPQARSASSFSAASATLVIGAPLKVNQWRCEQPRQLVELELRPRAGSRGPCGRW